jgi:hypothetical protein
MALSPAERLALGLDDPQEDQRAHVQAEFIPHLAGVDDPRLRAEAAARIANPRLTSLLATVDKATAPKVRACVNELLVGNLENADYALRQLFAANPKVGLELFIELAQFTMPKLKAVAVQVDDLGGNGGSARSLGFAQLQQMLSED